MASHMNNTGKSLQDHFSLENTDKSSNVAVDVFTGVTLTSICLLTVVGNFLVLYAVATEKKLQTVSNMFIVSLAVADLVVGLIVMPVSTTYIFTETWLFGLFVCQAWIAIDYIASTASILNLFILSLDRYWSVMAPLKYLRKRTKRRALLMISLAWIVSSMWIIPIVGWHYFSNDGKRTVADNNCDTEYAKDKTLKIITSVLNFFLPLTIKYILYGKIFQKIRESSKFELKQRSIGNSINSRQFVENVTDERIASSEKLPCLPQRQDRNKLKVNLLPSTKISTVAHSKPADKHKLSAVSVKTVQCNSLNKELKAARQLGVIMGAFTLCFFPYFTLFIVVALCESCISHNLFIAMTWVGYLNSSFNPFLYPLCNLKFRHKFEFMLYPLCNLKFRRKFEPILCKK